MGRTSDARERLVEAAAHLIHTRGYNAVGVNELCAAAGVKKGSFYHFFDSKVALVEAVIDAHLEDLRGLARSQSDGSPLGRLIGFSAAVRTTYLSSDSEARVLGCPIGNLAAEMSTQQEQIRRAVERCYVGIVELLRAMLDEAVAAGEIPPCDTRYKALELLTLMQGAALVSKAMADERVIETMAEALPGVLGVAAPPRA